MKKRYYILTFVLSLILITSPITLGTESWAYNYLKSETSLFFGDHIYGGSWNKTTGGFETVNLVTPDVYVQITKLICNGLNGFTCVNGTGNLTAQYNGYYLVMVDGGINKGFISEFGIKLFINGVPQDLCYSHFDTTATIGGSPSFNCYVRLNAGDNIGVYIDDHTNPVNDPEIENFNLNILRIGN